MTELAELTDRPDLVTLGDAEGANIGRVSEYNTIQLFFDSYIPMYNESFSVYSPHTIVYNDVTFLDKPDRPCTDDPGDFAGECN